MKKLRTNRSLYPKAKKSLGQHFLTSAHYAHVMCDAAKIGPRDTVLEIGPGRGILTEVLLKRGARVLAIEKDDLLCTELEQRFTQEIVSNQLTVINTDILNSKSYTLPTVDYKLIANIPYNITGEILRLFLSGVHQPIHATLMVQKEVVDRILSRDGKQSILSISVAVFGKPSLVGKVTRGNFSPQPKVDSAILQIEAISKSFFRDIHEEKSFFTLVKAGFAHKRKKLSSNIGELYGKQAVIRAFSELSLTENTRAEDMEKENWLTLLQKLNKT